MSPAGPRTTSASSPRCSACTARSRALPRCAVHALSEYVSISRPMATPHAACLCRPSRVNVASHRRWRNHTHSTPLQLTFVRCTTLVRIPSHSAHPISHLSLPRARDSRVPQGHGCLSGRARVSCSCTMCQIVRSRGGSRWVPLACYHSTLDLISLADRQPIVTFLRAPTLLS
jgi:hypothetical protein